MEESELRNTVPEFDPKPCPLCGKPMRCGLLQSGGVLYFTDKEKYWINWPQRPVPGTAKAFSIVAFVCGICSLVTLFVGIQFGIAGLVFASLSRRRAGFDLPRNRKGRIMSIIGLIVSVLWLILYIILFVYAVNGIVDGTIPTPTEGFYFFNT